MYEKLLRLGASYRNSAPTAEIVQLASDGVEQLEIYFGKYLSQFGYSLLAPLTLFAVLSFVSIKASAVLLLCVPLIPLSIALIKLIGMHMRKQHLKFRDLVLYGKKGALYSTLIRLANSYGMETDEGILISVPLTNQELANYSASARESLNRMLADLRKSGVIAMRGHLILIKDIDFLKEEIHCENCGKEICNIE